RSAQRSRGAHGRRRAICGAPRRIHSRCGEGAAAVTDLDPRLNAYRVDLADARLRGRVRAPRYREGEEARVAVPVVQVRRHPDASAGTETEWLFGDRVRIFERAKGWCWAQSLHDAYTGYVEESALAEPGAAPTHIVTVPRTFVYPEAELRRPP